MREDTYNIVKVVFFCLFIIVLYLFALGFRYETLGEYRVFDSWKEEMLQVNPNTGGYECIGNHS